MVNPKASFILKPRPPFRLDLTVWALRRRPQNIIDRWDGRTYLRLLDGAVNPVEVAVTQKGSGLRPLLRVDVSVPRLTAEVKPFVRRALDDLLGLSVNLSGFYRSARKDARLNLLVGRYRGLKPPQFPGLFEALANAIACQQLSLALGMVLLGRLARVCGSKVERPDGPLYSFPRPERVARLSLAALRGMGFSRAKSRALVEVAEAAGQGLLEKAEFEKLDEPEIRQRLGSLRGIGRWSIDYTLLRGLGRWEHFPLTDVGARRGLEAWLGLKKDLGEDRLKKIVARWQPYSGLVYFHLLLHRLDETGTLQGQEQ